MEVADRTWEECYRAFVQSRPLLSAFPSASGLVAFLHIRTTNNGVPISDPILTELLQTAASGAAAVLRDLLVLAFIPMMHSTSRQVSARYPCLSPDDIAQQVVLSLLQILGSPEFYGRTSHVAFAISRVLKRNAFEWAARELRSAVASELEVSELPLSQEPEESFERVVFLDHFLHRCQKQGLLTGEELELLVLFKLDATRDRNSSGPAAVYSNASRQRMKRLLAKLRRIARNPAGSNQLRLF
jgi:hypothetical protein